MNKRSGKRSTLDYDGLLDSQSSQGENMPPSSSKSKVPRKKKTTDLEYTEGSIVRIKLSKFLTYDSVELKPGPHLNVVIGPNGTGKSALVCAICLGLGGKTSLLGRASDPKDYIRHGADKAEIELELYNASADEPNYVIRREISRTKSSRWWINGRTVTQKIVENTVSSLNIQVGNLCQFLPQEKVADFARMSQQELLENTEKSVGEKNLYENHQKLKGAREKARDLEADVVKLTETLDQERQRNARLEQDVKTYNDRKKFLEKVAVLKMKKPWLEYNQLKDQLERAKGEYDQKADELKQERRHILPLEKQAEDLKAKRQRLETETREKSQQIRSKAKDLEEQNKRMHNTSDRIEEAKEEFNSKLRDEESRKKRLGDLQDQLRALEDGLAQMMNQDTEGIAASLKKVSDNMRDATLEMNAVTSEGDKLRTEINSLKAEIRGYEGQLKQIRDVSNRRMEVLRMLHQHTYDAVQWLRANKDRFKKTIYEPMIVSLNVTNPEDAKLVETHVSFNDLRSFVCEDPDDLEEFMRVMKNEQRLRVNAVRAPDKPVSSFTPKFPISHYKKYGFKCYLQSLFTCPEPVMRYLCLMYKVHIVPCGTHEVTSKVEQVLKECPELNNFYTPDNQYTIRRSRYTHNVSTRNSALKESRALADSVNMDRETELTQAIREHQTSQAEKEDQYRQLQKKSEDFERRINQLREEKRTLMKQKDQRKNLEQEITTKKQRIQQVMKEEVDIKAEEQRLQNQIRKIVLEKFKYLDQMRKVTQVCVDLAQDRVTHSIQLEKSIEMFNAVEIQLRNARQRFENLEREVDELRQHARDLKNQTKAKLHEAKQLADLGTNGNLEEVLKQRGMWQLFMEAPSQLDELEAEIHSMQARAEAMFEVDEGVVRDYERREIEIKNMEQTLARKESQHNSHQDDVSQLREAWLKPLHNLIARINENFSHFFSSMKCCGEVSLKVPENSEDYEKYGVCIKVKFRDEESLRELTATHQSGGERSVSTVLYMMALQELTRCPFRCVDEINQGMDPRNERKVFQLVVQTVCRRQSAQYFLLTPKLLPDLTYTENMTVLCVYNGPSMMKHTNWNLGDFIRRRAALTV